MTRNELVRLIVKKQTFLCVGLDPDPTKMPGFFFDTKLPLFEFNKRIIDATHDLVAAYKMNFAFYEGMGLRGLKNLKKTIEYIRKFYPEIFLIADAKRGDIGNSSEFYAREMFITYDCDAVTVSPYMGKDSIEPFLRYKDKWVIITALTSNPGADDFQMLKLANNKYLFEEVIIKSKDWGTHENTMYVVGATKPELLQEIRKIIPNHFLLIPGVGHQGGNYEEIAQMGYNEDAGLLVSASRSILFASAEKDFDKKARDEAHKMQQFMKKFLREKVLSKKGA